MEMYKDVDGVRTLMSDEEIARYNALQAEIAAARNKQNIIDARAERDARLVASDVIVARSGEAGVPVPAAWVTYRQALRDVPQQAGFPDNIQWPVKPE